MTPGPLVVASIPVWLWVVVSCGIVGAVGACVAAIVGAVMQRNAAQKLAAQRAVDAQALERLKADLVQKLDDERASDAQAIEHLRAQLAKLTHLSTSAEEKRAEVAADVLVGVLRMLDALDGAVSLGVFVAASVDEHMDERASRPLSMLIEVKAREDSVKPYEEEFRRAWHMAEVFLPEGVRDLLARINAQRGEILAAQRMHVVTLEQSPKDAVPFYRRAYGIEPQKNLGGLREQAKVLLRPIAQLGAPRG